MASVRPLHVLLAAGGILLTPVIVVLLPLILLACGTVVVVNAFRATYWSWSRALRLLWLVLLELLELVTVYIPLMSRVLWFYVTKTEGRHPSAVRCHIPYEVYFASWCRRKYRNLHQQSFPTNSADSSCNSSFGFSKCVEGDRGSAKGSFASPSPPPSPATGEHTPSPSSPPDVSVSSSSNNSMFGSLFFVVPFLTFPAGGRDKLSTLDVYGVSCGTLRPVVVFLYGGAWGSGKKWYYSTLADNIRATSNCCVVVADYPTFPRGTILDMVESVHAVLQWVEDHIAMYGGDKRKVIAVGHSAGGHLLSLWAMRKAIATAAVRDSVASRTLATVLDERTYGGLPQEVVTTRGSFAAPVNLLDFSMGLPCWNCPFDASSSSREPFDAAPLKATRLPSFPKSSGRSPHELAVDFTSGMPMVQSMMLFACPFDLIKHFEWERKRAVENISMMRPATDGFWEANSPTILARRLRCCEQNSGGIKVAAEHFPVRRVRIFHDTADATVSVEQSKEFRHELVTLLGLQQQSSDGGNGDACTSELSGEGRPRLAVSAVQQFSHGHADVVVGAMYRGLRGMSHGLIQKINEEIALIQ